MTTKTNGALRTQPTYAKIMTNFNASYTALKNDQVLGTYDNGGTASYALVMASKGTLKIYVGELGNYIVDQTTGIGVLNLALLAKEYVVETCVLFFSKEVPIK